MNTATDLSDLCRLCAVRTTDTNRTYIFHGEGKIRNIFMKITSCVPIELVENDYLPKVLCKECVNTLESFYDFRNICIKTELFLKNLIFECRQEAQVTYVSESFSKIEWPSLAGDDMVDLQEGENKKSHMMNEEILSVGTIYKDDNNMIQQQCDASVSLQCTIDVNNEPTIIQLKPQQTTPSLYRCHYCKLLFSSHKESVEHLKEAHKKIYKCDVCNEGFRSIESLAVHREKYLQQSRDKESMIECKKRKVRENELQNKCKECGKQYKRSRELKLHERSHTGEKPFACKYCEKTFAASSSRNKHVQVHEKRWSHICNFCGKGFVDKIHFTYHVQKQHTGERPFSCSQCDKKFVRKQDLKMHKINFHSTRPRQCYKCEICNNVYTTLSYLKQHKQIHEVPLESRKKFKCNICDSVFLTNNKLKQHILIHTGELPFECEICKKRYSSKMGLKIHLLIHSGVKKYVCEVCAKPFALRNSLICHRRTHTGERPYQCDICQQQFTQKSSLNTHKKRHTRDELAQAWNN